MRTPRHASGATLAALRRVTATDHQSVDTLIDPNELVEISYYAAVMRGLIGSAECVERTLPQISQGLCGEGLSPANVSKRMAIDAESSFLDDVVGHCPVRRPSGEPVLLVAAGSPGRGTMLGLLYVYVGSALGGLHLLRVARTASWWRHEREHLLLRPYGEHLGARWRAVLTALERLDLDETNAAVAAASAAFEVHRRFLVDQLAVGAVR